MINMELPEKIKHWAVDSVAECLPVSKETCARLWNCLSKIPGALDNRTELYQVWSWLSDKERTDIINAFEANAPP